VGRGEKDSTVFHHMNLGSADRNRDRDVDRVPDRRSGVVAWDLDTRIEVEVYIRNKKEGEERPLLLSSCFSKTRTQDRPFEKKIKADNGSTKDEK
jgi:hypothetical protein